MVLGGCPRFTGMDQGREGAVSRNIRYSIILPVCHGGRFLKEALKSLGGMDYPPELFEVLVAGNTGDPEPREITSTATSSSGVAVRYLESGTRSRPAMLNLAIAEAKGSVLVFADDDCVFFSDWLRKMDSVLERKPGIGILGGQDVHAENDSPFNLALDYILNSFIGTGGLRKGTGRSVGKYYPKLWNMAIPRGVAEQVALTQADGVPKIFDEALAVHEDVELADRIERAGWRIVYAPEVRVRHSRDTTLLSFIKRNFTMARTSRSIGVHLLPHSMLSAFALGLPGLILLSSLLDPLRNVFTIIMAAYLLLLLFGALGGLMHTKRIAVLAYVPVLLGCLHFARGLGFLFPWPGGRGKRIRT